MIHSLLSSLDSALGVPVADGHCDIPCKIYDPQIAQISVLSIIRLLDLIQEIAAKDDVSLADQAQLSRLVQQKEIHATQVKEEVRVIWGDYFKQPQCDQFPDTHALVHQIMLTASACKQHLTREPAEKLLLLVNEFAASFWATKGVDTFVATCPYPPAEHVVYPALN